MQTFPDNRSIFHVRVAMRSLSTRWHRRLCLPAFVLLLFGETGWSNPPDPNLDKWKETDHNCYNYARGKKDNKLVPGDIVPVFDGNTGSIHRSSFQSMYSR